MSDHRRQVISDCGQVLGRTAWPKLDEHQLSSLTFRFRISEKIRKSGVSRSMHDSSLSTRRQNGRMQQLVVVFQATFSLIVASIETRIYSCH